MTLRSPKKVLKRLPMPAAAALSSDALKLALARLLGEPHDGWADLVVHPSQLRPAMRLAGQHAAGQMKVRALTDTTLAHEAWVLRSATAEVVNL